MYLYLKLEIDPRFWYFSLLLIFNFCWIKTPFVTGRVRELIWKEKERKKYTAEWNNSCITLFSYYIAQFRIYDGITNISKKIYKLLFFSKNKNKAGASYFMSLRVPDRLVVNSYILRIILRLIRFYLVYCRYTDSNRS